MVPKQEIRETLIFKFDSRTPTNLLCRATSSLDLAVHMLDLAGRPLDLAADVHTRGSEDLQVMDGIHHKNRSKYNYVGLTKNDLNLT